MPEYESIDAFAEHLLDDDRERFTFEEAEALSDALKCHPSKVIRALKAIGLSMEPRQPERRVRGFQTNSHDRWFGPGSSSTHGGSGWEQINGFSGPEG